MEDWEEVRRVKEGAEAELLGLPGVVGVDVGYKQVGGRETDVPAIRVYVRSKRDVPEGDAVPRQIGNVPTDVIERDFILH